MELTISICALVISLINLFWQLINGLRNLKIQVQDWYINDSSNMTKKHYVFRLAFINKSFNSISVSSIYIKYGNYTVPLDYQKVTLLYFPVKDKDNNEILYGNRLYSHEIPFRIDGLGVDSGYFGVWDLEEAEILNNISEIEITVNTNRGRIKKKVKLPPKINIRQVKY